MQRHGSKLRKILRLNTSSKESSPNPSSTSPPDTNGYHQRKLIKRSEGIVHSRQEDILHCKVREDTLAALEGKKSPRQKPHSSVNSATCDLEIELHIDKHGPMAIPILNTTDAAEVIQNVRPGHARCIVESWPSLGIQRPIRYFEPLSDIVSTWDFGASSCLRLGKNIWGESLRRLEDFPTSEPPSGEALFYYYVTADRKWSKRTVSVENGALKVLKKDRPYDKDYVHTINLENFDIYTFVEPFSPNSKLRCPTRYCFALKSQHKQSLFGKNTVFAHYFAIENDANFARWYGLIRDVKTRLIAEKKCIAPWMDNTEELQGPHSNVSGGPCGTSTSPTRGPRLPKPLLSPEDLMQPASKVETQPSKSIKRSNTVAGSKPASVAPPIREDVFIPGGLLGAEYEEKKRLALMQFKEERVKDPLFQSKSTAMRNFTQQQNGHRDLSPIGSRSRRPSSSSQGSEAPNLQHRGITTSHRPSTPRRPSTSGDKDQQAGTLISFGTDEINTRLPHHKQPTRGRARTVSEKEAQESGGLISFVGGRTGEEPHSLPQASLVRRPTTAKPRKLSLSPDEVVTPFTGRGLLAGNIHGAGSAIHGHGIKTSRDAMSKRGEIQPLMEIGQRSLFLPGSLLERREREMGPTGPIIDRELHDSDSEA